MKKFLSILTSLTILSAFVPEASAVPVSIEIGCVCFDNSYEIYGDEPRVQRDKRPNADGSSTCTMQVEIQPTESVEEPDRVAVSGLSAALDSLSSLRNLAPDIAINHSNPYHTFLDEKVFAPAIAKISEFQDSAALAKFLEKEGEGTCNANSSLPNCVAERALCSYEKYSRVLFQQSGQPALSNVNRTDASDVEDVTTIMTAIQNRDQALYQEAVNSEQALDTAMTVYSQFFETYRLHLRFKEVIAGLVKVRNVTSFLRQLVGCIPNKFVGVATTKCN